MLGTASAIRANCGSFFRHPFVTKAELALNHRFGLKCQDCISWRVAWRKPYAGMNAVAEKLWDSQKVLKHHFQLTDLRLLRHVLPFTWMLSALPRIFIRHSPIFETTAGLCGEGTEPLISKTGIPSGARRLWAEKNTASGATFRFTLHAL